LVFLQAVESCGLWPFDCLRLVTFARWQGAFSSFFAMLSVRCVFLGLLSLVAGFVLPMQAVGHGAEFLLAKLSFDEECRATLEMTADYGDNPMIAGQDEARAALADMLRVEVGGVWQRLSEVSPVSVELRSQLDLSSPMPYAADANNTPHELLVARWQWLPTSASVRFKVPKGGKHDVLFWRAKELGNAEPKQWNLLIAEDVTPSIEVPKRSSMMMWIAVELSGVLVFGLVVRALRRMDW
jgi:hypothetical protein